MGNALQGKTYVKGSARNIQPNIIKDVEKYQTKQRISTSSNIHSTISFHRERKSEAVVPKKIQKTFREDIDQINDEDYDETKYPVKRLFMQSKIDLTMS